MLRHNDAHTSSISNKPLPTLAIASKSIASSERHRQQGVSRTRCSTPSSHHYSTQPDPSQNAFTRLAHAGRLNHSFRAASSRTADSLTRLRHLLQNTLAHYTTPPTFRPVGAVVISYFDGRYSPLHRTALLFKLTERATRQHLDTSAPSASTENASATQRNDPLFSSSSLPLTTS